MPVYTAKRIHYWHSNTINYVSRSKFITQRDCQLRNGIISERSAKVTLITKITHSYTIIVCNAQTEYCAAYGRVPAQIQQERMYWLYACYPYTHTTMDRVPIRGTFQAVNSLISQTFRMTRKTNQCVTPVSSREYEYLNTHLIRVYSLSRHLETARRPVPS